MIASHTLKVLKSRVAVLEKAIEANNRILQRNSHKSRSVRMSGITGLRRDFFVDRKQELELTIRYLEGDIKKKDFLESQVGE